MNKTCKHIIFSCAKIIMLSTFIVGTSSAQNLPKVFMIGEHEMEYENMVRECNTMLLSVCQDSMNVAYDNWLTMLSDIENYAKTVDFDIKGVKIWINVFWNKDGTLKHIVYYPKPNSKNMDFDALSQFFQSFTSNYKLSLSHINCFSHYGSASFPTFSRLYQQEEK